MPIKYGPIEDDHPLPTTGSRVYPFLLEMGVGQSVLFEVEKGENRRAVVLRISSAINNVKEKTGRLYKTRRDDETGGIRIWRVQ